MEEQLVSFETAKLAKEKGFDWDCRMVYKGCKEGLYLAKDKNYIYHKYKRFPYKQYSTRKNSVMSNAKIPRYTAPTQSLLQKWLRETHDTEVFSKSEYKNKTKIGFYYGGDIKYSKPIYKTYEEALEIGLQKALKLI